jgi:arylsulfatase
MAREGARFRDFYSASPVCSPARAALLTGRYPTRCGVPGVLPPNCQAGLPPSETTIAGLLKDQGYTSMCIGKWHLGSESRFLPFNRGFDRYFGVPYSNDMTPLPLLRNTEVVEQPANLDTLTQRYTEEALRFITEFQQAPFFLYLAHTMPHIPLGASSAFRGRSAFGAYGDAVEELDWSVGEVLRVISDNALDQRTLVLFTSDNGPWYQGSAGRLRGRKGETYEGGVRAPFLARMPGSIPEGLVYRGPASTLDLLPTVVRLAGAPLPVSPVDGVDIWPLLSGEREAVDRPLFLYFSDWHIQCVRAGPWKLHLARYNSPPWTPLPAAGRVNLPLGKPELYNLDLDPEEAYDVAPSNPQIVAELRAGVESLIPTFPDQVQTAWRDTINTPVWGVPAGALPNRREGP